MPVAKKKNGVSKTTQQKWVEVINDRGIKQSWIADKAEISEPHLSNILSERVLLTEENRAKINEVLGTDF